MCESRIFAFVLTLAPNSKVVFLASTSFLAVAGVTSILGSSEQRLSFSQEYDSLAFVKGRDMTPFYQHV